MESLRRLALSSKARLIQEIYRSTNTHRITSSYRWYNMNIISASFRLKTRMVLAWTTNRQTSPLMNLKFGFKSRVSEDSAQTLICLYNKMSQNFQIFKNSYFNQLKTYSSGTLQCRVTIQIRTLILNFKVR